MDEARRGAARSTKSGKLLEERERKSLSRELLEVRGCSGRSIGVGGCTGRGGPRVASASVRQMPYEEEGFPGAME